MTARLLKDPATINSRIFVGHLQTEDMNKHDLEEHFQKYGNVVGSLINRGFGFVQFEDEQSALQAIQNENGTMFKGRRIDVRPAKKDNQNVGGGGGGGVAGGGGGGPGLAGTGGAGGGPPSNSGGNENQGNFAGPPGGGNVFGGGGGSGGNQFGSSNDSFGSGNQSFGGGNQNFSGANNQNFPNDQFGGPNLNRGNDQFPGNNQNSFAGNQLRGAGNDQFGGNLGGNQPRGAVSDQFGGGNQNRGAPNQNRGGSNEQFGTDNQNRGPGDQFAGGSQNRGAGNQNRGAGNDQFGGGTGGNQNQNSSQNQNQNQNRGGGGGGNQFGGSNQNSQGGSQTQGRPRGNRGGKNRNKNRDNGGGGGGGGSGGGGNTNSFRDRSPINRGMHIDDKGGRDWDRGKLGDRGRGIGYGRDSFGDIGSRGYDDFGGMPGSARDVGAGFGPLPSATDYQPSVVAEKNDCEIIVVSKALTEYAEAIEMRLKKLGLTVDLLFPNEDVPLSRVLGNIASRGCLYAVVVTHMNQEHRSLTLNILHGLPQEHRNMPVEDAITLINRDFTTSNRAGSARSVPINVPHSGDRHPDAVQVLLNMLADNRQLTVSQYDRVMKYLEVKREEQVQIELGDAKDLATATSVSNDPKQAELQSRILNILNSSKPAVTSGPVPSPVPAPTPGPPANWGAASSAMVSTTSAAPSSGVTPSPLLNDPTVQKALDSLLQGNLLKSIGDQQPAASTPLFAAFAKSGRY